MKGYDFAGYATRYNVKCADGRTILPGAFKEADGKKVPIVWQHLHDSPENVLGHGVLEFRKDGVYVYGYLNDSPAGKSAKVLVQNKDIEALSVYANKLLEQQLAVRHGVIREVSLVLSGANPGAFIDDVSVAHGNVKNGEKEAIIFNDDLLSYEDDDNLQHEDEDEETVQDVLDTLNDKQKRVVYALLSEVVEGDDEASHSATSDDEEDEEDKEDENLEHSDDGEENIMKKNVFETDDSKKKAPVISHADFQAMVIDAKQKYGGSFRQAFLAHIGGGTYGIDNISVLFPDAQNVTPTPDLIKRDTEWVNYFLSNTRHVPFSRVKSTAADLTPDAARAKGYVTGNQKVDEVFALLGRETTPTTVYKKQKLDRDDVIDITTMDVVAFMKAEMRLMLNEEIARAGLVGDGRLIADPDKIDETKIRPIYKDADLYAHKVRVAATADTDDLIEEIIRARKEYKRSGNPAMFTTTDVLTDMLLLKDTTGRRIYKSVADLEAELRVSKIIEVEVMENVSRIDDVDVLDLVAILVNPRDYTYGADRGGEVTSFEDFDIDFNQHKYLIEGRASGALTHPKSALVIEKVRAAG